LDKFILRDLISQIENELISLEELRQEMRDVLTQEDTIIFRRSIGSILHDFYNCCERIFRKIAIDINGGYVETEQWHKALLYRMTIPIKDIRPAVVSEELAADLDEYLSFRHVFRNIYGFELKGERVTYLAGKFDRTAERFTEEIKKFLDFLNTELSDLSNSR